MDKFENSIGEKLLLSQALVINNGLDNLENDIVFDLLDVASNIFMEDVKNKVNAKGDPRNISLTIPVTNIDLWKEQKTIIEGMTRFLSGDRWNIEFIKSPSKLIPTTKQLSVFDSKYDSVTLLSGGLDSFCGSYLNIKNKLKALYCGYKINQFETHGLNCIHNILKKNYESDSIRFEQIEVKKDEHTQRTRSFLFFTLACACASVYNIKDINLYENGVLSLNPELDSRKTTKTTHPKTIYLMNELFKNLGLEIKIKHPFLFSTKGEMINNLSDEFKEYIKFTNTCGSARSNRKIEMKKKHCGFCIPCMLRKISMAAYGNERYDVEYNAPYETTIQNCNPLFKSEFKSSNEYFQVFNERIKDGSIFNYLNLSSKYYKEKNYLELTKDLLNRFSREVDTFYSKYPL